MPGKPYTMREMKQIVEYLIERNAYGDIRGRKMWIEFANSRNINRTWQSLKETFIKRILPDIHNPYYKLTVTQISSFRQGYDVTSKNKLEIYSISNSSSNADSNKDNNQPSTSKNHEQNDTGEDIQYSKIQEHTRSSTDTLVLENCYENAEDIIKDLESPHGTDNLSVKSLRDCIIYTEPLTPMLQEVLHDFDTDDDEPKLHIVEDIVRENCEISRKSDSPDIRQSKSYEKQSPIKVPQNAENKQENKKDGVPKPIEPSKIKSLKLKKTQKGTWENKDPISTSNTVTNEKEVEALNNISKENAENPESKSAEKHSENSEKATQRSSTSTVDTQLPNNQEGLLYNTPNDQLQSTKKTSVVQSENKEHKEKSRKRERSQTSTERKKKPKKNKNIEASTETQKRANDSEGTISSERTSNNGQINYENQKKVLLIRVNEQSNHKAGEESKDKEKKNETSPSKDNEVLEVSPSEVNPCLKSVSLFAEQFSTSKYSDSESDNNQSAVKEITATAHQEADQDKGNDNVNKTSSPQNIESTSKEVTNANKLDDPIVLKSNSDSDSVSVPRRSSGSSVHKSRGKALAKLFGFSSGYLWPAYRKKHENRSSACVRGSRSKNRGFREKTKFGRYSQRSNSKTMSSRVVELASSDEETTESDNESLSQDQRYRHLNKYAKPDYFNILSNGGGMGLFVAGRKRVYPLMLKEGKSLFNATAANSDSDEEESYWKSKYLEQTRKLTEEKIRANELAKLLEGTKQLLEESKKRSKSPILPANRSHLQLNKSKQNQEIQPKNDNVCKTNENIVTPEPEQKKLVRIKFTKDREIEFEGSMSQMEPMIEKMVQFFNVPDNAEPKKSEVDIKDNKTNVKESKTDDNVVRISSDRSSRHSTPSIIDPEAHEKMNKVENEIFKTIEEMDKQEDIALEETNKAEDENVTKRKRGRPKTVVSITSPTTSIKKQKKSKETAQNVTANNKKSNISVTLRSSVHSDSGTVSARRTARIPKKYNSDAEMVRGTHKSKSTSDKIGFVDIPENDSSIRYKFPKRNSEQSSTYSKKGPRIFSSPDYSRFSESTQGYQDSDISPKLIVKKTRVSSHHRKIRRSSHPYLADIDSCESNVSYTSAVQKTAPNSSLNSEVYRSESYELMKPKAKPFVELEKNYESRPIQCEVYTGPSCETILKPMVPLNIDVHVKSGIPSCEISAPNTGTGTLGANSSNVSFPLSPELSVVEHLSIVKDLISDSIEDHPTLNETHASGLADTNNYNKYFISDVDISVPLMAQNCELRQNQVEKYEKATATQFLANKIHTVNMEESSSSDSLDQKLQNLLLESAKKLKEQSKGQIEDNLMEVDTMTTEVQTKRVKKRCSTPRKTKRSKTKTSNPETLEEHTTSCSYGGKTLCPPTIIIEEWADNNNLYISDTYKSAVTNETRKKKKKKKDVIRVKIQRPKRAHNRTRMSVCTDSGIHDTESGVFLQECYCCNDSVDLIHNHSDTCLQTKECLGDSVEIIENSTNSVISLHDTVSTDKEIELKIDDPRGETLTPEMFSNDAQDCISQSSALKPLTHSDGRSGATVFHSPSSNNESFNSLLTEDLSDDVPVRSKQTKWYLFSEDETNTNLDAQSQDSNATSVGANLNQIFSLTCAVPNLSTISEISKENDSKRFVLESDFETISSSQSLLD